MDRLHQLSRFGHRQGTSQLRFNHWRPWEGDASILDRFTLTVQVGE